MVLIKLERVGGFEPRVARQVVQFRQGSACCHLVAVGVQVAGVARVEQKRFERRSAGRCDAYNAGLRIAAKECAVRVAVDFNARDAGAGNRAEVEAPTHIFGWNAIDEDFVAVRRASTDE